MLRKSLYQEKVELTSLEELESWVAQLKSKMRTKEVWLIEGPMGAGKTQFVVSLVKALGGNAEVMSPTFALHNLYSTPFVEVDHLDLYRLEDEEDLESSGFWDLFEKDQGLILVEWADKLNYDHIPPSWPITRLKIQLHGEQRAFDLEQWS